MRLAWLKNSIFVFSLISLLAAGVWAEEIPYYFVTTAPTVLRNSQLQSPVTVPAGSVIRLDTAFLLANLGTATPTQDQVQRLLLNPGEASHGRIDAQRFYNIGSRRASHDYFFEVSVTRPDGQVSTGNMALQYYSRTGMLNLRRSDGVDPRTAQSSETAEQLQSLQDQNRTEAERCDACDAARLEPTRPIADIVHAIEGQSAAASPGANLWAQYQTFARDFTASHRNITRANAGRVKREYVRALIDRFGAATAGRMMTALTAFAEAPHRNGNDTQMAELAAVMKVVENRASSRYSRRSRTLRDIGVSTDTDARLTNILADWQFSAWNDRDNNLRKILSFSPDRSDNLTKRKMELSFEAQYLMNNGRVTFEGRLNDARVRHYHANYVTPNWARSSARINDATVVVNGTRVNLSRQRGARHLFYVGIQ